MAVVARRETSQGVRLQGSAQGEGEEKGDEEGREGRR